MKKFLLKIWDSIDDFVLEAGRVMVIAALPILYDSLSRGEVNLKLIGLAMVIAALKAFDRWLHEKGIAVKGLTRF